MAVKSGIPFCSQIAMRPFTLFTFYPVLARSLATIALFILGSSNLYAGERPSKTEELQPATIYHNYCSVCHGDRGDGRSRASSSLSPPPRDFTSAPELTRDSMITIVTHGKSTTAMVGWKTQLNPKEIEAVVDYVRKTFMIVALDPRMQRGKLVYAQNCVVCHGERGQGTMQPIAGSTPARDLASPQARAELSRERLVASVSNGRPGTAMAAFGGKLPPSDIEAVVDYVGAALMVPTATGISGKRAHGGESPGAVPSQKQNSGMPKAIDMGLAFPKALTGNAAKGEKFFKANCATCHGVTGDGKGPRASVINPSPRNFLTTSSRSTLNRPALFAAVSTGKPGTEMPAWSAVLGDQEIADVSEYVYRQFIRTKSK